MAITKTEKIDKIEVMMHSAIPTIVVIKTITVDDTEDAELPVSTQKQFNYEKVKAVVDADGNQTEEVLDYSAFESPLKEICTAVWGQYEV